MYLSVLLYHKTGRETIVKVNAKVPILLIMYFPENNDIRKKRLKQ